MNNIRKYTAWLGAGAIMITLATGCTSQNGETAAGNVAEATANSTENMASAAGDTTENMASAAGNKMDDAGSAMSNGAMSAGNAVTNGVEATSGAIAGAGDAAIYTPKIKTALGAEAALKGSKIDVDTLGAKRTIALRGTVTSAAQKTMAEAVAKKNAPADFKVDNQLKMGKMDGKM